MTDKKEDKPNIEGFMTDDDLLKQMGFGSVKTHTKTHYKSKISLSMNQLNDLNTTIPYALKELLPGYEIIPERGFVNLSNNLGMTSLEKGNFYFVKKDGKDTGDVVKVGSNFVIYEGNGNRHISFPISDFLPKHLKQILKGERFGRYNLNRLNPIIDESLENLRRLLEPVRTNRTIEQIVKDVKISEPEKLECEAQNYDVLGELADLKEFAENLIEEKGSFGGMGASDEKYIAPDSKNSGEIYIKKEDERFTGLLNKYPRLKELTAIAQGPLIINYLAEEKIEQASSYLKSLPDKYRQILEPIIKDYSQNLKINDKENLKGG